MIKPSTLKRPKFPSDEEFASQALQNFGVLETGKAPRDGGRANKERVLMGQRVVEAKQKRLPRRTDRGAGTCGTLAALRMATVARRLNRHRKGA
jgi:hypothetical protein